MADNSKRNPSRVETGINKRNRRPIDLPDEWLEDPWADTKPKGKRKSSPSTGRSKPKAKPRLWGGRKKLPGDPSLKKNKPKTKTKPTLKTKPKPKTAPKAKPKGRSPMNFAKAARNRQKSRIYET